MKNDATHPGVCPKISSVPVDHIEMNMYLSQEEASQIAFQGRVNIVTSLGRRWQPPLAQRLFGQWRPLWPNIGKPLVKILLSVLHQPIRLQHGVTWTLFNRRQVIDRLWEDLS